jgi:integrase
VLAIKRLGAGTHCIGGDVPGLYLQVSDDGRSRSWVLRAMIGGKRREMGLGPFPEVLLKDAREAARVARESIRNGGDPIAERQARKSALRADEAKVTTFKAAALAYIAAHEGSWKNAKHRQQWANTLATYAYPIIGQISVADIDVALVLKVLEPVWSTKPETASRIRNRLELILDSARARGLRSGENPARLRGHLDKLLAKRSKAARVKHHAALPYAQIASFMKRLGAADGMGARALEFAILTAARSGEVRHAVWAELDLKAKVWTVPAARMKAHREHRVPLSEPAIELLERLPLMAGTDDLVFPAPRGGPLSDMTLSAVCRRMKVDAVPHGFRSTFRDWAGDIGRFPGEVAELALAHAVGDATEQAYRRSDGFEKRRKQMAAWAQFCAAAPVSGTVSQLRRRSAA